MSLLGAYSNAQVMWAHRQKALMAVTRKNITAEERQQMETLRQQGCSYRQIAKQLGRTYNGVRSAP